MKKLLKISGFGFAAAILVLAPVRSFAIGPDNSAWPMRYGNAQGTSTTTFAGPRLPKISWNYGTSGGGLNFESVVLGSDGTIYSGGGAMFALNPDGSLKWVATDATKPGTPAVADNGLIYVNNKSAGGGMQSYSISGSGNVTFFSSASITGFDSGTTVIAPNGDIITTSGDSEWSGPFSQRPNIYTSNLTSKALPPAGAGSVSTAIVLSTDAARACYIENGASTTEHCFRTTDSAAQNITTPYLINSIGPFGSGISIRNDGSMLTLVSNNANSPCPGKANGTLWLGAFDASGASIWQNCTKDFTAPDIFLAPTKMFAAPVSSSPATTFILNGETIYSIGNSSGGIQWAFKIPQSLGFDANSSGSNDPLVSPLTLAGGSTIYFSYCPAAVTETRVVALNANTGIPYWDTVVSSQNCHAGQPVPGPGNRLFLWNAGNVIALEDSNAKNIAVSSNAATTSGPFIVGPFHQVVWLSTVSASITDAGGLPVSSGVPVEVVSFQTNGGFPAVIAPGATGFLLTDNTGAVSFPVYWNMANLNHASFQQFGSYVSTIMFRSPGIPDKTYYLSENRASTFTVTASTPSIEDDGINIVQVTTFTFTVRDAGGGRIANYPVGMDFLSSPNGAASVLVSPAVGPFDFQLTNSVGQATYTVRVPYTGAGYPPYVFPPIPVVVQSQQYSSATTTIEAYAFALNPFLVTAKETRSSTFTVTFSTPTIQPDLRATTMTVTVYDINGSTVPNTIVALDNLLLYSSSGPFRTTFKNYKTIDSFPSGTPPPTNAGPLVGYTDAFGQAKFLINLNSFAGTAEFDSFNDFTSSFPVYSLDLAPSTPTVLTESNFLTSYSVVVPTITTVGVSFVSTVTAINKYNHELRYYNEAGVNLLPLLSGTNVQGTGTLGTSQATFASTPGQAIITGQNYNKVEIIQVKATRSNNANTGLSQTMTVIGPDHFSVTIPTGSQAGVPFAMTINALDSANNQVTGYAATLSLASLQAGNTSQAGAGILGVTNINMPANGFITFNQTYTKTEAIKIRATDSAAVVTGYSSSATITAGPPASITLLANPQSTIASLPVVMQSTVLDLYSNPIAGSTVTFSIINGSGTVAAGINGLPSNVITTNTVTNSLGQAQAFFASTNTFSSQADVLRASINGLVQDTTVYNAVLITPAGGTAGSFSDPLSQAIVPANAYSSNIRFTIQRFGEVPSADVALATTAMASQPNTFVSNFTAKITAVTDSNPNLIAPAANKLVTIQLPVNCNGGNVQVGSIRARNLLVPLSVMRVFKLNKARNVFEMVLDGTNLPNISKCTASAQVTDPTGIYALGAPPYTTLTVGSSATVTTTLASGATVSVNIPKDAFSGAATIQVGIPTASSVPAPPAGSDMTPTGLIIEINANGLQPQVPVTVNIGYQASDIAGLGAQTLKIARYDAGVGWVLLESSVDTLNRTVTAFTNHFTPFQIMSVAPGDLAQGFIYPNPFRPSQGHVTINFANFPAAAHFKIYTVAGRLLQELDTDSTGQLLNWPATDKNGNPLPSGVYLAVFKSGKSHRSVKFAVQK